MLSQAQIQSIFPFSVIIAEDARILGLGRTLQKRLGDLIGASLWDHAAPLRSHRREVFSDSGLATGRTVMVQFSELEYILTGAFYAIEGGYVFVATPRLMKMEELGASALTIADFAPHEPVLGYLFILQTLEASRSEAVALSQESADRTAQLEQILDLSHDLIFTLNDQDEVTFANPSARKTLEIDAIPEPFSSRVVDEDGDDWQRVVEVSVEREARLRVSTRGGRRVDLRGRVTAMVNPAGGRERIAFFRDVTEELRFERDLREANEKLVQSQRMEAVGRLAGAVAHDFNNLLAVIMGGIDELRSLLPDSSQEQDEHIELVITSAEKGAKIAQQLLMLSNRKPAEVKRVDVVAQIRELLPILDSMCKGAKISIAGTAESCWVAVDSSRLEQLVMNLVMNASQAIGEDGHVTLELEVHGDETCTLSVSDDGCGMSDEVKNRMFEPFFTTKGSLGGSGIGLSTVFAIVQEVGGEIDVESTEGVGTRVALRFATIPAEPEAPQVATSSDAETVSGLAVVVEDNHGLNRLVAGYLKALGLDVVTFGGATEARRDWGNVPGQPRILVTDVLLGDGCGLELAEELQQSGAVDKVLVVTGRADTEKVEAMMQRYGWYLLMKPFRRAQLRERVLGLLRESASS